MTFDEWAKSRPLGEPNSHGYLMAKAAWQAATRAEREECAKLVENRAEPNTQFTALHRAAKAIRARNEGGR